MQEEVFLKGEDFSILIKIMHFLAKLADRISFVFVFVGFIDGRKHFSHRSIFINQLFKTDQFGNEIVHLSFAFRRSHEEKDIV